MARDFAKAFYHSHAWLRNRKAYILSPVDTQGHVLKKDDKGWFWEEDGIDVRVPDDCVVPPGMCERCFRLGELTPADTVHHIKHLSPANIDDPHYTLAYSNFMRVCRDCHAWYHSGMAEGATVTFDEQGNVIGRRDEFSDVIRGLEAMSHE